MGNCVSCIEQCLRQCCDQPKKHSKPSKNIELTTDNNLDYTNKTTHERSNANACSSLDNIHAIKQEQIIPIQEYLSSHLNHGINTFYYQPAPQNKLQEIGANHAPNAITEQNDHSSQQGNYAYQDVFQLQPHSQLIENAGQPGIAQPHPSPPPSQPDSQSDSHSSSESSSQSQKQAEDLQTKYNYEFQDLPPVNITQPLLSKVSKIKPGTQQIVENSEEFPFNLVGCLQCLSGPSSKTMGTGTVIGSRYVLTAAHNIFNITKNKENELKSFSLRYKHRNEKTEFSKQFKIRSWDYRQHQFVESMKHQVLIFDYAFVELQTEEDLEQMTCFKFDFNEQEAINAGEQFRMISYPFNREMQSIQFINSKGTVKFHNQQLYHRLQTSVGSSGASIFKVQNGDYAILGVHSGKGQGQIGDGDLISLGIEEGMQQFGVGSAFTRQVFKEFVQWVVSRDGVLDLKNKEIGIQGCKLLRQALKESLRSLNLTNNRVGVDECSELVLADWKNLQHLNLTNNEFCNPKCFQILKDAEWPLLTALILNLNRIEGRCCQYLVQANFPNLTLLNLGYNIIGNIGCKYLKRAKWPKLQQLYLYWNKIEAEGCEELSQASWPLLTFIDLHENFIDGEGCKHLAQSHWPHLSEIILDKNIVGDEGCMHLSGAGWINLKRVHLWRNSITEQGCNLILNCGWNQLQFLNLSENDIKDVEKFHQLFASKFGELDVILE